MYCKNCGKEVADGVKFCAECGTPVEEIATKSAPVEIEKPAKKKKKRHPILGTILLVLGIFIIIGALAGGGEEEPEKVGTQAPTTAPTQADSLFSVCDQVELHDIIVTLVDVSENTGVSVLAPQEGKVFVLCEFEIVNNSDKEIAVSTLLSFSAYIDDYATSLSFTAMANSDIQQLDGTVAPGKKMHGVIGYEADEDWETIEIRFTPDFWANKDIIYAYSK